MPLDLSIFHEAIRAGEAEETGSYVSLPGSSPALFFSLLAGRQGTKGQTKQYVLLCHAEDSAAEAHTDALFWARTFNQPEPVLIYPGGDPRRLKAVRQLYEPERRSFVSSVEAALSPLWFGGQFPILRIGKKQTAERDFVIGHVSRYGYKAVPIVSGQGEFSVRGGIVDIFPPESELPVRIEFFGDEIESLRYFDIDSQRTITEMDRISVGPAEEPEQGPNLIDVLGNATFVLNEPDDIKRRYPELSTLLHNRTRLHLFQLPLSGEGFSLRVRSLSGMGLLRDERSTVDDFVGKVGELKSRYSILMVCSSEGQARRLRELFFEDNLEVPILDAHAAVDYGRSPVITTGELSAGFVVNRCIVLAERDIFGKKPVFRPIKKSRVAGLISSIEDFRVGDYLVHIEHGIGVFLGLQRQRVEQYEGDFIVIEYLGGDRVYVPLEQIRNVQKYHAPEGVKPRIDKLGGKTWQKTRQRVKRKIRDMAERLLALYARRSTVEGHAFSGDTELHKEFDGFFLYEETPDQLTAIAEIKQGLESRVPMDRLLCGDVGYGKTEVVMRACFKAVYDAKQVAVLVPTTILAEQHYDTFTARFSAFPIRVDFLSRFKSRAEQKKTLQALADGEIDIVIGTHRLFARDVRFYDLGLLVIDEEHRFGVAHKEKIKALKTNVDILTLSATPIPRTLHMALSGIRAMSVIETPPEDRLAVKSYVSRFNPELIRDVLQKELDRDGQSFFVHNRVQDIYKVANFVNELLPHGRVGVAHGQMNEKELEQVMRSFFRRETDVLVSTAIIGAGLDIPTANTIIINRADTFGLADLYQLRGRVGRSRVRAYAYFLIPGEDIITEGSRKKLQAIQELSYLGAGFRLALRDMEIRGAGNLLGAEQSGHMEAVGFDLYVEILEQTVAEIKGEKVVTKIDPALDFRITATIPEHYVENAEVRMSLYRKISLVKDAASLTDLYEELKDRFGPPPEETERLLDIMQIKLLAITLSVKRIENIAGKIRILFAPETPVTPEKIFSLYRDREKYLRYVPEGGIELGLGGKPWGEVFREVKGVMEELTRH